MIWKRDDDDEVRVITCTVSKCYEASFHVITCDDVLT